jgi:hypothetical protein
MTEKALQTGLFMRRETTQNGQRCPACYASRTRMEVHRSRYELERILNKHGADDVWRR